MTNNLNYSFKVFGRVQGVGFRAWTKKTADKMNILGYVMNCTDGTVEIEIFCDENTKNIFKQKSLAGPVFSKVERIEVSKKPKKQFFAFNIT